MDEGAGMQDCVHQAAGDSSRALRAASKGTPCPELAQGVGERVLRALETAGLMNSAIGEVPVTQVMAFARALLSPEREIIDAAHDYLRDALGLLAEAPRRFDYYAQLIEQQKLPLQSQGREVPTGHSLNSEARPEGALASSGPDEPTPDSAEPLSVELRQRMGRE